MYNHNHPRFISLFLLLILCLNIVFPLSVTYASPASNIIETLANSTLSSQNNATSNISGGGLFKNLFGFLFDSLLKPILNLVSNNSSANLASSNINITPLSTQNTIKDNGVLKGKTVVVDPGHGGSNPGAVANNNRESDNNLAVGLKLRDKLTSAGAKVIMTRDSDRTVASEGSSLREELQARVDIAESNHADIFVSLHSNENSNSSISGITTFYHGGKSLKLGQEVQNASVQATQANDKGTSSATFYVLRNTSMPGILVEMGFVSNPQEAALLESDSYRNKLSQGIFDGIVNYFNNN